MAAHQHVYVMKDLTKAYPGGRDVFKGITLSFLPDAKIGVLGPNGAGKSTLMRIMSGQDKEFGGEAWAAPGARVGYLPQEPHLDPEKTVGANVREAFSAGRGGLAGAGAGGAGERHGGLPRPQGGLGPLQRDQREVRRGDVGRGDEHAPRRAGRVAGEDRRRQRVGDRPHGGHRARRAALPAGREPGDEPLGRRAAARRAVPAAAGGAAPPAAPA